MGIRDLKGGCSGYDYDYEYDFVYDDDACDE